MDSDIKLCAGHNNNIITIVTRECMDIIHYIAAACTLT